jgi:xylulokinase
VDFVLDLLNLTGKHHILGSVLRRSKPGAGGLVALPYLVGERTPIMDPRARSIFFGISNTTTREDIIRASVEAVAYSIRHNVDEIEKLGYKTNITLVTGGMTKTPEIVQILASALNKKIYLVSEASEPLGDTIVAKVMSGLYKWSDFMGNIPMRKIFYPKKEEVFVYQELYQKYLKIYENLKDIF